MTGRRREHVVLGAGAIGRSVVTALERRGQHVTVVSRSGTADPEVRAVAGELSDPSFARSVCADAAVVYHCVNPPYQQWEELFPGLHTNIIEAAAAAGARLVMADNLYMYGSPEGGPMSEHSAIAPVSAKGELRARMAEELLEAHRSGRVQAVIGRASDYFGPHGLQSHMGERVFDRLLAGKKAQLMGNPDTLHTYTYLPDIGRSLVTLGASEEALGQVWHLPSPATVSTRRFVELIGETLGNGADISAMSPTLLTMLSWVSPLLRSVREEIYQLRDDWVMDDTKYRSAFEETETPVVEAISTTIAWFRERRQR